MDVGTIIEFAAGSDHRLGVVTGELGKKKLVVWTEHGDEMRPSVGDVTRELGRTKTDDTARMTARLRELRAAVEGHAGDVDLEVLWELVGEMDEAMAPEELADLMLGSQEPAATVAVLGALRTDHVYFKSRRDGRFEPRPRAQVEALLAQRDAEQRKEQEREDVLRSLAAILAAGGGKGEEGAGEEGADDGRQALIADAMQNDAFRAAIGLLKDFAAVGDEFERRRQADELLDELDERLPRRRRGRGALRAFYLLVDMGIWSEHENLWLYRFRIATTPPPEILEEAKRCAEQPWAPQSWREDLSGVFMVTIDDPETRDVDDALSCTPLIDGGFEVGIHIADPAEFVAVDSPLDRDARQRATSLYLPTGTIPMFPDVLSEGMMSLVEGQLRPAISTVVTFDTNLDIVATRVFPSVVRVDRRLSYEEVDRILESEESSQLNDLIHGLDYIASECMSRREQAGAVQIDLPEAKVRVKFEGDTPQVECTSVDLESGARMLVGELMILCNRTLAEFCHRNKIPTLYRSQESPDSDLLDDEVMAVPEGLARSFAMLRKMKRGDVTTVPSPHFGLGLPMYVQATSPIRRYSDLICQRQIKAFLAGEPLPYDEAGILEVLAAVDETTREAIRAERETVRYWTIHYMSERREPMDAVVVEVKDPSSSKAFVFVQRCAYKTICGLKRQVPLGTTVQVEVDRADPRKDTLILREA